MKLSTESWYMPAPMNGGQSMAKTDASERKKKWLSRYLTVRREIPAIERLAEEGNSVAIKRLREINAIKAEIQAAIETISDANQRAVLSLRYIGLMEWHEIAETMHFSDYVYVIHRKALRNLNLPAKPRKNSPGQTRQ